MSAEIISFAAFRARRALAAGDTLATRRDRRDLALASLELAASIEHVRRQVLLLHRARLSARWRQDLTET
jgi:hypothetical protein